MILTALAMVFTTLLLVANIIAVKLIGVNGWVVPVAVIAYPLTFLVTDTIAELYGRRIATRVVWLGFAVNVLMVALIYLGKIIPPASFWEGQDAYNTMLGSVPRIVLASMLAYLASQHHDVFAFNFWRRLTNGRFLWLRNNASTMVSQGIDTVLFITVAFAGTIPLQVLFNMIIGQYVIKLVIAILDTPLCYGLVALIKRRGYLTGRGSTIARYWVGRALLEIEDY